jgi:hypothetical protein
VKSQRVANPQPPATAAPFTAAMVTLGNSYKVRNRRAMVAESVRFSSSLRPVMERKLSRSMPEQNALPAPVSMTICTADCSISSRARSNSPMSS